MPADIVTFIPRERKHEATDALYDTTDGAMTLRFAARMRTNLVAHDDSDAARSTARLAFSYAARALVHLATTLGTEVQHG